MVITFRFNAKTQGQQEMFQLFYDLLNALTTYRASTCNANRITVNDCRLLCVRKIIDQLNYLHRCDSIMEGYQYSMSKDRAFEYLLLEIYSSFILTTECNHALSNGNRPEWSPFRAVIISSDYKIGRPRCGSPICLSRLH